MCAQSGTNPFCSTSQLQSTKNRERERADYSAYTLFSHTTVYKWQCLSANPKAKAKDTRWMFFCFFLAKKKKKGGGGRGGRGGRHCRGTVEQKMGCTYVERYCDMVWLKGRDKRCVVWAGGGVVCDVHMCSTLTRLFLTIKNKKVCFLAQVHKIGRAHV